MPKKAKIRKPKHSQSLHEQIEDPESYGVRTKPRSEKKRHRAEDDDDELLDVKLSGRILKAAREQQQELDAEELFDLDHEGDSDGDDGKLKRAADPQAALRAALQKLGTGGQGGKGAPDDDSDDDSEGRGAFPNNDGDEQYDEEEVEVDPEDERALAAFLAPEASSYRQTSLADLILARLKEQQAERGLPQLPEEGADPGADPGPLPEGLEPRVVEVYRGVGKLLSRYTTGKIPKAFKIIPNLRNWEDVLYLTDPGKDFRSSVNQNRYSWSVHAMYQASRLFVSNLNARLAQRFLALVLLPRVRAEIRQHKRLHFALFQALRKATYKPGAFYKGILLPLCQSRTCTLREAVILTSVLKRASLPVLHSAAALLRLAQLEYCGTTSFFMRVLLDKKYALPYRVIDALVDHFVRFADDERQMPVVWHQTMLCFVQRYKHEVRADDLLALRALCGKQHHYKVTPEVLRELDHALGRGGAAAAAGQAGGAAPMAVQGPAAAAAAGGQPKGAKVGSNVVENVRDMPPVLMMED
ncbi:bystin-like protein [Volvox carteri f. nagariensis]|uniref:Bystin n=1 Tax=Volvox carteri f. nagariensis TaxID=3068 RepID=D8TQ59_VOLCA|nr:bystin-like protein [Volvox carteri f. nagariensis]EFJ50348.1 bystin-like protein [Volvox carteri f. nagariensis]|eukprot:XP_002948473.1 bystin-like protein [Volvox carteri f. nagariensis]